MAPLFFFGEEEEEEFIWNLKREGAQERGGAKIKFLVKAEGTHTHTHTYTRRRTGGAKTAEVSGQARFVASRSGSVQKGVKPLSRRAITMSFRRVFSRASHERTEHNDIRLQR